jgi:transcription-repair coupling factor (superfamily II helicase)
VTFEERNTIDPGTVVRLMQQAPREYRLEGPLRLRIARALPTEEARVELGGSLMKRLSARSR